MSSTIKVIKGTTEISLMNLSGLHVHQLGWDMNPADKNGGIVRERIRCVLIASDMDDAASQFQALNGLLEDAVLYSNNDPVQDEPVYIQTQHMGETNKRFALLAGDYARYGKSPFDVMAQRDAYFEEIDLVVTRAHPWSSHRPGILPGRIQLSAVDGPDYDPDETDYDVDLVSTLGQQPTTCTGGIIGRPGKFGRGVQVAEVMENLIEQTVFGIADISKWGCGGGNGIARSTDQQKFGTHSLKCTYVNNTDYAYYAITLTAVAHVFGTWIYVPSDYDGTDLRINFNLFDGATSVVDGDVDMTKTDQWQFVHAHTTPVGGDLDGFVMLFENGDTPTGGRYVYIDGVDCYTSAYPLPHCDGDLGPGHSWSGAVHDSTSDRVASALRYDIDDISTRGTISFWMKSIYEEDEIDAHVRVFCLTDGTADNRFYFVLNHSTDSYHCSYYGSSSPVTLELSASDIIRLTNAQVVITWDLSADELKIFVDGSQIGSTGTGLTAPSAAWDRMYIGAAFNETLLWSGWLDDIFLLDRVMSEGEISDLHDSGKPFVGDPNLKFYLPFDGPRQTVVANYCDDVELTHFYVYNDQPGQVLGENRIDDAEVELFPNAVGHEDRIIFGSDSLQPIRHVVLNLRGGADLTTSDLILNLFLGAECYTGVLGVDYSVYPGETLNEMMECTGLAVISIHADNQDWDTEDMGGTDTYWVQIVENHESPAYNVYPWHIGPTVYNARHNELRIPAASLHGDAPPKALLRLHSFGGGDDDCSMSRISRIIWGIKSKGLDAFTSHLNAGDEGNPAGWNVTYGDDTTASEECWGSGGYSAGCTFDGDESLDVRVIITGTNMLEYWLGKYRVFLLCRQSSGEAGEIQVRLRTYIDGTDPEDPHVDSRTIPLTGVEAGIGALDMGELQIPFADYQGIDDFSGIDLIFHIFAERTAGAGTLRIWALVLMPIDQASGTPNDTTGIVPGSAFALLGYQVIDHDGGILGAGTRKVVVGEKGLGGKAKGEVGQYSVMNWDTGGAFVEINQLDVASRIYFLLLHYPTGGSWGTGPMIASRGCSLIAELYLHHRYRLLRGND